MLDKLLYFGKNRMTFELGYTGSTSYIKVFTYDSTKDIYLTGNCLEKLVVDAYERVFETAFTPDGASVAYGTIDGKQIMWKVEKL